MQCVMTKGRMYDGRVFVPEQVIEVPGDVPQEIADAWIAAGDCRSADKGE